MKLSRLGMLGLLVVVAACSSKPVPPVAVQAVLPVPPSPPVETARIHDSETAALAAYPKYARRDGGKLILSYDGRDIARLTSSPATDCEGWETCSLWSFAGVVRLTEGPVIVVRREHGEGENYVLFDRRGHREWLMGPPLASPDGRHVAAGLMSSMISTGLTEIVDWQSTPHRFQDSETSCHPVAWQSASHLKLSCNRDDDGETPPFDAEAHLVGGVWQLVAKPQVAAFKPRPLRDKATQAEGDAWEQGKGVEILP
ncbi:hypothetical protein [Asticcacaulis sp. AC402]|uniref:hypothetical protein n=1 Tax=Asticcacaulis sp. AC402 TaxID=1282361 RepID=UPI0003C3CF75|nr:hypothetical protein [Asticcacaulis sp. AC402]ESQ77587.1 hypothetical protein ABAC402_00225 [Asticcacaulis sp. AC402]